MYHFKTSFDNIEDAKAELKSAEELRDKMIGSIYRDVVIEDIAAIKDEIYRLSKAK